MANEHLLEQDGVPLQKIQMNLVGWSPKTWSGFVPRGGYELQTVTVIQRKKKDGAGMNLEWHDLIVGPSGEGVEIVTVHPAPVGDPESKAVKAGVSFFGSRLNAYCQHAGKDPEGFKKPDLVVEEATFKGKKFFAYLEPGEKTVDTKTGEVLEDYSNISKLTRYLSRAEYEAAPGPRTSEGNGQKGPAKAARGKSAIDTMATAQATAGGGTAIEI